MKFATRFLVILAVLGFATVAPASVIVDFQSYSAAGLVDLQFGAINWGTVSAGEMELLISDNEGSSTEFGYCVDLYHALNEGPFEANVIPAPVASPWCEVSYILLNYEAADSFSGSVIQVAIWKALYGKAAVTVSPASVNDEANAIVDDAAGKCALSCFADVAFELTSSENGNLFNVKASVYQNQAAVAGQFVELSTSCGFFTGASSGDTNAAGEFSATVDVTGCSSAIVSASTEGQSIFILEPLDNTQQLLTLTFGDPCDFSAETKFTRKVETCGDPHTIGFWKHQVSVATGGKGKAQVPASVLASYVPFSVFDVTVDDLDELYDILWLKKASMKQRAIQQCSALSLNVAHGEISDNCAVNGFDDFADAFAAAEAAYFAGDYETAKTICDDINNM
ncbi:hypothetical protein K8I61_05295 [bacterium]|nr:hypothetical protein [bacterium]